MKHFKPIPGGRGFVAADGARLDVPTAEVLKHLAINDSVELPNGDLRVVIARAVTDEGYITVISTEGAKA